VSDAPSIQDVFSIRASLIHTSVDYPCVGKSDCVTEQSNAAQGFSLTNNPYSNYYNNS